MDKKVELLRRRLHALLSNEDLRVTKDMLKVSKELDQLTTCYIIDQIENQIKNQAGISF
jgi:hypothetical protein